MNQLSKEQCIKDIHLNCGNTNHLNFEVTAVMNGTLAVKESLKNSGLYGIWTYDICDTSRNALLIELLG